MSLHLRIAGALCCAVLLSVVVGCSSDDPPPAASSSSAGVAVTLPGGSSSAAVPSSASFVTHPPLTGTAASSVIADLGSGDQARVTSQLVLPTDVTLDPSVFQQLQALNPINLDDASFKQLSDSNAQVYAKVGSDQKDWTLVLIWQNDRWQLGDTLEGQVDTSQLASSVDDTASASDTGDDTALTTIPVSATTG